MALYSRNYSLDTLKTLCCISVIVQHCNFVCLWVDGAVYNIISIAVPLFFMISGYFNTEETDCTKYIKRMKRIGKILIFSLSFYVVLYYLFDRLFLTSLTKFPEDNDISKCLFLNDYDHIGRGHHWYLAGYLYVLAFFAILKKFNYIKIFVFLPLLSILQIIAFVKCNNFHQYSNFLLVGIPCYSFGMLVKKYFQCLTTCVIQVLHLVSLTMILLLALNLFSALITSICQRILSMSIFVSFASIQQHRPNIFSKIGEKYILYIYVFHMAVIDLFFSTSFSQRYFYHLGFVAPIIIIIISVLVSVIYKYFYNLSEVYVISKFNNKL